MIITKKGNLMPKVFLASAGHVTKLVETFVPMISRTEDWISTSVIRLMWPLRTAVDKKKKGWTQVSVTVIKTNEKERKGRLLLLLNDQRFFYLLFFFIFERRQRCPGQSIDRCWSAEMLHGNILRCRSVKLGYARSVVVCSRGFFPFHYSYVGRLLVVPFR